MIKFPQNFLWGAATSAYQVEGNNIHSDWWHWEKKAGKELSGAACRHYEFYKQDFDLAKSLHHNAHRLSIEWGRIEPEEGKFSDEALQHYVDVILALKARGIEPVVTLHHFTNPVWFSNKGGWTHRYSVKYFLRYCNVVTRALAKHVNYWITINEPNVYISHSYLLGAWPPQGTSIFRATAVEEYMAFAHVKAYQLIHKIYQESNLNKPAVSIAQNVTAFMSRKTDFKNRFITFLRDKIYNLRFFEKVQRYNMFRPIAMDFIGVNYYSRQLVELKKIGLSNLMTDIADKRYNRARKNSLGWDIYPTGLYEVLLGLKKYQLPIMVTENGICTADDEQRWKFIQDHLKNIYLAMKEGVQITGYLYWSLLDNFEWDKGFDPRFGLINVDYKTFKRTVRESGKKFGKVCKTGIL